MVKPRHHFTHSDVLAEDKVEEPCSCCGKCPFADHCWGSLEENDFYGFSFQAKKDIQLLKYEANTSDQIKFACYYIFGYGLPHIPKIEPAPRTMFCITKRMPFFLCKALYSNKEYNLFDSTSKETQLEDLVAKTILLLGAEEDANINYPWESCFEEYRRIKKEQEQLPKSERTNPRLLAWIGDVYVKVALMWDFDKDPQIPFPEQRYRRSRNTMKKLMGILMALKMDPETQKPLWLKLSDLVGHVKDFARLEHHFIELLKEVAEFPDSSMTMNELALKHGMIHLIKYFLLDTQGVGFKRSIIFVRACVQELHNKKYDRITLPWVAKVGLYSTAKLKNPKLTKYRADIARSFKCQSSEQYEAYLQDVREIINMDIDM